MFDRQKLSERIISEAIYIVENNTTIRQTDKKFGTSKSTVHKDITKKLKKIDEKLYNEVRKVLDYNISQRAIRGGRAAKKKYKKWSLKVVGIAYYFSKV